MKASRFERWLLSTLVLSMWVGSGCTQPQSSDVSFVIPHPDEAGLMTLPESARETLRATIEIPGFLAPSPLVIDQTDGSLSGTFTLSDDAVGPQEAVLKISGAKSTTDTETLLFRSTAQFTVEPNVFNSLSFEIWEGNHTNVGDTIPFEFDVNRNGRSNWTDLLNPNCNPVQEDSPVVLAPRTVGFESGVELGGFTRSFVVVENRSNTEAVHFDLEVQMAPGVTVAPLDTLLVEGGRAASSLYRSIDDLDENAQPQPLAPNGQRVFAVTFAPTSREFLSGALSLSVETLECGNRYGELARVLGNPDGAVPDGPEDYVQADFPAQILDLYSGAIEPLDESTLFSSAPALARVDEVDNGTIFEQDIDAAYIVFVPEGYQFSLVFDGLSADIDLFLYELNSTYELQGREPIDLSQNTGLGPESISYAGSNEGDVFLVLGIDRVTDPASPDDVAKVESGDANPTMYAGLVIYPEFLESCAADEPADTCVNPVTGSSQCPAAYSASVACGPAGAPGTLLLRGNHFLAGAQVEVGGVAATCSSVEELDAYDEIRCTVPVLEDVSDEGETVSISLRNPDGQFATFVDGFTYLPPSPTVTSITPSQGPVTGGTPVSIRGTSFGGALGVPPEVIFTVTVEEVDYQLVATDVIWVSKQQLNAVVPDCATVGCEPGLVSVTIVNPDGQPSSNGIDFNYTQPAAAPPAVDAVTPSSGPRRGGTLVTLTGSGFEPDISVRVGGTAATNVQVSGTSSLTFKTPPGEPGIADVTVVNPDGQTGVLAGDGFQYELPQPLLANVSPANGPIIGGYQVSIWGTDFEPGISVFFGTRAAQQVAVVSSSLITALVPAGNIAASVDVSVEDVYGAVNILTAGFEYTSLVGDPPSLTSIVPTQGTVRGGETATISGENFETDVEVFFGDISATSVTKLSDETLRVVTPAHPAGMIEVIVRNPDGREASGASFGFEPLIPALNGVLPATGSSAGGTVLTLSGENFDPSAQVFVGDLPCLNMTFINTRSLSCRTPLGSPGITLVRVVNPDGTATESLEFIYFQTEAPPPQVLTVNPSSGEPGGGFECLLSGEFFSDDAIVYFGDTVAEVIDRVGDTTIWVTVPPGEANSIANVLVQNGDGQVGAATFFYGPEPVPEPGAPIVDAVAPDYGPTDGGTLVHVYGQELSDDTEITIGGALCLNSTVIGPRLMSCEAPAGQAGNVDVVVQNPRGSDRLNGGYRYEAPAAPAPEIYSISPGQGRAGDLITISGGPFVVEDGFTVTFASLSASLLDEVDTDNDSIIDQLIVVVPAGLDDASATLRVQNPDGQSATAVFTYLPAQQDNSPIIDSVAPAALACNTPVSFWVLGEHFTQLASPAGEIRFSDNSWVTLTSGQVARVSDIAVRISLEVSLGDFGPCVEDVEWSEEAELILNFIGDDGGSDNASAPVLLRWETP